MEYENIINSLDNTPNHPTKFRTKNWVEIPKDECRTYDTNSQIQFKNSLLKSSLCDCSAAYILVSGTISVEDTSEVDNAKDIDRVMPIYNLIEYSNNFINTTGSLWQYYWDEPSLNKAGAVVDFAGANHNSKLFKHKQKITGQTGSNDAKNVEIMVPLKYLSNLHKTGQPGGI